MKLNQQQLVNLIDLTVTAQPDSLGCDGCYELFDQFAQIELDGKSLPTALEIVRTHLTQCKCCRDEYAALMTALQAIATESDTQPA